MSVKSQLLLSIEAIAGAIERLFKVLSTSQKHTLLTLIDISLFLIAIGVAIGFSSGFDRVPSEIWQSKAAQNAHPQLSTFNFLNEA